HAVAPRRAEPDGERGWPEAKPRTPSGPAAASPIVPTVTPLIRARNRRLVRAAVPELPTSCPVTFLLVLVAGQRTREDYACRIVAPSGGRGTTESGSYVTWGLPRPHRLV